MTIYRVRRLSNQRVICTVRTVCHPHELVSTGAHSPDGFETGYGGSGPSELALCILADYFAEAKPWPRAWRLHHAFKDAFIAISPLQVGGAYEIRADEIAAWLDTQGEPP